MQVGSKRRAQDESYKGKEFGTKHVQQEYAETWRLREVSGGRVDEHGQRQGWRWTRLEERSLEVLTWFDRCSKNDTSFYMADDQ